MTDILIILIPLLLLDVLNPVLFALMLAGIGSDRPLVNSLAILVGHTVGYLIVGIVVALGLEKITDLLANPKPIDYAVSFIIGLVCLYAALNTRSKSPTEPKQPEGKLTPVNSLGLGAIANFIGTPFAVTYFVAIDQILRADLSVAKSLAILIGYNAAYATPFAMIPLFVAIAGDRFKPILKKVNNALIKLSEFILPWILGLLGLFLVIDAVLFFTRGAGLY